MDYTEGKTYVIDADFNNSGEVQLIKLYGKHFCHVKDRETGEEWVTMLNRLTTVQECDASKADSSN